MLGLKTIGNATLIAFDGTPVLTTDPWIDAYGAYFGSWALSHEIPPSVRENILQSKYVWISHGHPDHLDSHSLRQFKERTILLPDHYGARIYHDLLRDGYTAQVMPDRSWVQLSSRVKAMCISDYYQDAILLLDVGGRLFVNLNDARDRGWGKLVRSIAANYRHCYLLKLCGYGDADMINFYDEGGKFIPPIASRKRPVGTQVCTYMKLYNCNHFIPFSSFHRYQRTDSIWANAYTTPLDAYSDGFDQTIGEMHTAFVTVNCENGDVAEIRPSKQLSNAAPPEQFGDNWSDALEPTDVSVIRDYFQCRKHVWEKYGWVNFRVGGADNRIEMAGPRRVGITFEVPRGSLMAAIGYEVFDDLLIGNFMRTILHGNASLYPDFTPYVAKFADNGRAYSKTELDAYMSYYRRRAPLEFLKHNFETKSEQIFRKLVPTESPLFSLAKRIYVMANS